MRGDDPTRDRWIRQFDFNWNGAIFLFFFFPLLLRRSSSIFPMRGTSERLDNKIKRRGLLGTCKQFVYRSLSLSLHAIPMMCISAPPRFYLSRHQLRHDRPWQRCFKRNKFRKEINFTFFFFFHYFISRVLLSGKVKILWRYKVTFFRRGRESKEIKRLY